MMENDFWPQNRSSPSEMSQIIFFFLPQKNRTKNKKIRAIFRFFWFWSNGVFSVFWRQIRWNTSFGQNRKNRKIALIFMFLVRFFFCKKNMKIWDISDGLERFWGQKIFSAVFKIAYYVNIGFSSIFFEQHFLKSWPLARSWCPKIAKISKIGFSPKLASEVPWTRLKQFENV